MELAEGAGRCRCLPPDIEPVRGKKNHPGCRRQRRYAGLYQGQLQPLYKVAAAADGSDGISKARKIVPHLIVSDIMMPGADGYELCRVLERKT